MKTTWKRNEDIAPGDVIRGVGVDQWYTVASTKTYDGPLREVICALVTFRPGTGPCKGTSLTRNDYSEVLG